MITAIAEVLRFEKRGELGLRKYLVRRHHSDHVPRADLGAEFAPDANRKVNRADTHCVSGVPRIGDLVDAIHRAHRHARVAAGAQVLIEDRKLFG